MPTFVVKLAPQAIVLAVVLYWVWPSLTQKAAGPTSAPKDKKAAVSQEFSAAILSPSFPSPSKRNPFEAAGTKHVARDKKGKAAEKDLAAIAAADAKDSGLTLNATFVVGKGRLAMINGTVYKEKETIRGQGDDPVNWLITDILPHKVLLLHQGVPLQLCYTNGAPKMAATKAADKKPRKPAAK
jgi:hypothetical protein